MDVDVLGYDDRDAEAIAEAAARPVMRSVALKTPKLSSTFRFCVASAIGRSASVRLSSTRCAASCSSVA
jgi:transposase